MQSEQSSQFQLSRRLVRTLFQAGQDGYAQCRIPVLVATARGTLLAVCEARHGDGDWGETHLLLRRSEDGGATWDQPRPMHADHGALAPNPLREVRPDWPRGGGLVHGNAVFIPTPEGLVHLVYCVEYYRVFHRVSRDDGRTWEAAEDITAALDGLRERYPFRICATGPGHGVRLGDGTLVVPVWLSLGCSQDGHHPSVVTVLRCAGGRWCHGDLVAVDSDHAVDGSRVVNPNESCLVALGDGGLLIAMRSESPAARRLHAVSHDGGLTFAPPAFAPGLYDTICHASYLRSGGRILFAGPDPRQAGASPRRLTDRRNLVFAASDDEGATWRRLGVIEPGYAGYSHLAAHGGRVWCLYEGGSAHGNHHRTGSLDLVELEIP